MTGLLLISRMDDVLQSAPPMPYFVREGTNMDDNTLGIDVDDYTTGLLRVPPVNARPNSAPAAMPNILPLKNQTPNMVDHYQRVVDKSDDLFSCLNEKSGLLSTPIQGSLDFNFPVSSDNDTQCSFAISLEQELRKDAEVRGRSLSPKKSTFEYPFREESPPPVRRDIIHRDPLKTEDLSKLRLQQQELANQLRFLQEQEWAILERRPSLEGESTPPSVPLDSSGKQPSVSSFQRDVVRNFGSEFSSSTPTSNTTPLTPPSRQPIMAVSPPSSPPSGKPSNLTLKQLLMPHMLDLTKNPPPPGSRLEQFVGQIGAVAKDQHGCRFLQKLCEEGHPREITQIFDEIAVLAGEMMIDPFGNYLMQKLCEHCSNHQRTVLVESVAAEIPNVSTNMHGTRAVQKVVDQLKTPEHINIIRNALSKHAVEMIKDLNGNHVIQKCLQKFDTESKQFLYDSVCNRLREVAMHRHGCCVLQRCIDFGSTAQQTQLINEVVKNALPLVQDPFGNYVVQYVLDLDSPQINKNIVQNFIGSLAKLATNKFSSNVVEKCLKTSTPEIRTLLYQELTSNPQHLPRMLQDQYANYVIQTAFGIANPQEFQMLSNAVRPFLSVIKNTPHGKRIESKMNRGGGGGGGGGGGSGTSTESHRKETSSSGGKTQVQQVAESGKGKGGKRQSSGGPQKEFSGSSRSWGQWQQQVTQQHQQHQPQHQWNPKSTGTQSGTNWGDAQRGNRNNNNIRLNANAMPYTGGLRPDAPAYAPSEISQQW